MGYCNDSYELMHYGVKGMKWGVRRKRPQPVSVGRSGGKVATDSPEAQAATKEAHRRTAKRALKIGAAVVGTVLAAYGGYTISKAYGRQMSKAKKTAQSIAKGMATASKMEQEIFKAPAFDKDKYDRIYSEEVRKAMKRVGRMPIKDVLKPELSKQGRLISDVSRSLRKRITPSMFDIYPAEPIHKIINRYNA